MNQQQPILSQANLPPTRRTQANSQFANNVWCDGTMAFANDASLLQKTASWQTKDWCRWRKVQYILCQVKTYCCHWTKTLKLFWLQRASFIHYIVAHVKWVDFICVLCVSPYASISQIAKGSQLTRCYTVFILWYRGPWLIQRGLPKSDSLALIMKIVTPEMLLASTCSCIE